MKITKFKDIPQFTSSGSWQADFPPKALVKFIKEEIEEHGLQLNPDFQRSHVWTKEQQIAYLEYFFKGGKTGRIIYLNNPSWHINVKDGEYNDYVCVDGLQRITAFQKLINNEIPIFGTYYNEFEDNLREMSFTLKVNINDLKSKKEVLQWYVDMNIGGTPHSKEEIEKVKLLINNLDKNIELNC